MSSNDAYCAICGAPAHDIDIDSYDTSRVSDESAAWLDRVNILAKASQRRQRDAEAFFTGPVNYRDYNWYEPVAANMQLEEQLGSDSELRVYDWTEPHDVLVPLHDDCYDLLKKVAAPRNITLDVIYETLRSHCPDGVALALDYDYGDASTCQGEHWKRIGGMEYLVASPTNIPRVEEFMELILADSKLQESDESFAVSPQKDDTNKDALNSLPGELMSSMLESLDYDSIF
ncbi:F-box domain [Fusarium albosuccineum]|uniref:F-box domain n=1 Tax=Fusarium albosuccineum TaxID=1237068 RepID=A0A8H4PJ35_9HYPO|nr:F-box domain [Fusarium albosuccineum]